MKAFLKYTALALYCMALIRNGNSADLEVIGNAPGKQNNTRSYPSSAPQIGDYIGKVLFLTYYGNQFTTYTQISSVLYWTNEDSLGGRLLISGLTGEGFEPLAQVDEEGITLLRGAYIGNGQGLTNLNASQIVSGNLGAARGGTGIGSYTTGDLIYANSASSLAKLPDLATGNVLRSGGVGVAPAWGKLNLQTDVAAASPLSLGNGGTGSADGSGLDSRFLNTSGDTATGVLNLNSGALVNNTAVNDNDLKLYVRFDSSNKMGCRNYVDGTTCPIVNGSPAAAAVINDGTGRSSIGNCMLFDGVNDWLNFGDKFNLGTSNFSLGFWIKWVQNPTSSGAKYVLQKSTAFALYVGNNGEVFLYLNGGSPISFNYFLQNSSNWMHLAVSATRSGNALLYLNGVQVGSADISSKNNVNIQNGNSLIICSDGNGASDCNAYFDEYFIYHRALSASEIRSIYSSSRPLLEKKPGIYVASRKPATQSISNNSAVTVTFGAVYGDPTLSYDASNGSFTAPIAGKYFISTQATFDNGTNYTGWRCLGIYVGGGTLKLWSSVSPNAIQSTIPIQGVIALTEGQTVDVRAFQSSGSSLYINSVLESSNFYISWIGE